MKQEISQRELAKRLEKPHSYVAKYEGLSRRIDPIELMDICQALALEPSYIFQQVAAFSKTKKDSFNES